MVIGSGPVRSNESTDKHAQAKSRDKLKELTQYNPLKNAINFYLFKINILFLKKIERYGKFIVLLDTCLLLWMEIVNLSPCSLEKRTLG